MYQTQGRSTSKYSAGHFRKWVRNSANYELKVFIADLQSNFLTANICSKKLEIYRKSAT